MLTTLYRQRYPRAALLQFMNAVCKLYDKEKICAVWIGFRPFVFFYKPDSIETLLNNSNTISKSLEYGFLKKWLGTGLLTSDGNKWRTHRKLLTPAFHFQILDNFLISFNEQASILTKMLESDVGKLWIDIVPKIKMCTLDIICETAMGVHLNAQSGGCKEYVDGISEVSDIFMYRIVRPWLWTDIIFLYCFPSGWKYRKNINRIHNLTKKVIKEKKELMLRQINLGNFETTSGKPKKKAFLELLLEQHLKDSSFTEENIREEVDTFMFEGHDTTAMAISWTLYELGRNPGVQERVFQELDNIFGGNNERDVTTEDLKQMKYLECVIKETLRLYPSVAFIGRQLKENLKVDNYTLTPGCTCVICVFIVHQDPEYFPNPTSYNPDRFLPENNHKRHPFAYIPFSAGPRNCIGQKFAFMEEKTVLTHILRKFEITSLDPRDKIETLAGLILQNAEPIRIRLVPREL